MTPVPPLQFSEPELQLLLRIFEDTGTLDQGGEIKDINDKVHEHYVDYLCSQAVTQNSQ